MSKSSKFSDVIAYFEKLASQHIDIAHKPTEKHFFRMEIDEFATGLPSQVRFPAIMLESYTYNLIDRKSDNPVKVREGAFVLMDYVKDMGDYDLMHQKWDKLEAIGDEIIARLRKDKRNINSPMRDLNLDSVTATLITFPDVNNVVSIRYSYEIQSAFQQDITDEKWDQTIE